MSALISQEATETRPGNEAGQGRGEGGGRCREVARDFRKKKTMREQEMQKNRGQGGDRRLREQEAGRWQEIRKIRRHGGGKRSGGRKMPGD